MGMQRDWQNGFAGGEMDTELRFVVDMNVGRLAKWLRVMGYDTLFPKESGDNQLVRIALSEDRVLVEVKTVIALNKKTYQVEWNEKYKDAGDGIVYATRSFRGLFNVDHARLKTEKEILFNPFGLIWKEVDWMEVPKDTKEPEK